MLDTIETVLRFIGSWVEPLWEIHPDVRDPFMVVIVFGLGGLLAIGAWKR